MVRSYLYVPGDRPDLMDKAVRGHAHALILDLEDGVAPGARPAARTEVGSFLARCRDAHDHPALAVRVHPDSLREDAAVAVTGRASAVYLPKADLAAVERCSAVLAELCGAVDGPRDDSPRIVALVESATGVLDAPAVAASPWVEGLALGESDLLADLGCAPDLDEDERRPLRLAMVVASAAAGRRGPTAPASTDYRDLDGFRESCRALRRLGYAARSAVHPAQVPVINETFAPTDDEVARARALVDRFDAAVADGRGVVVGTDGTMIDEAVVRAARRLLS